MKTSNEMYAEIMQEISSIKEEVKLLRNKIEDIEAKLKLVTRKYETAIIH